MIGIYKIAHGDDVLYVGQSIDVERRWKDHKRLLRSGNHANAHLQNCCNLYGCDELSFSLLEIVDSKDLLDEREGWWIEKLSPRCNMKTPDGEESWKVSDETRRKLSESHKGYVMPEEQKRKIKEANLIAQNTPEAKKRKSEALAERNKKMARTEGWGTFGKHLTDEEKKKISESNKRYWERMTEEERGLRSEMAKERWLSLSDEEKERRKLEASKRFHSGSEESKRATIEALAKGREQFLDDCKSGIRQHPMKGKHLSEDARKHLSELNTNRFKDENERKKTSMAVKAAMVRPDVAKKTKAARLKKVSAETRRKQSEAKRGKKQPEDVVRKRTAKNIGKKYNKAPCPFTKEDWEEMLEEMLMKEIARKYSVSNYTLSRWRREIGVL